MMYTVNVKGNKMSEAKQAGYHSYYANGVTAIEIEAKDKREAGRTAWQLGFEVLYVFE